MTLDDLRADCQAATKKGESRMGLKLVLKRRPSIGRRIEAWDGLWGRVLGYHADATILMLRVVDVRRALDEMAAQAPTITVTTIEEESTT